MARFQEASRQPCCELLTQRTASRSWGAQSYNCQELNSANNWYELEEDPERQLRSQL